MSQTQDRFNGLRIYRKLIEIPLATNTKVYGLDKYQSLNGKPVRKLIVPPLATVNGSAVPLPPYNFDGAVYVTPPLSEGGRAVAPIEAIDGAYLCMVNMKNQKVDDGTPLSFFKNDTTWYGDKGLFCDCPTIDFTQSNVYYPTTDIPNANPGTSIMIVVEYWDVYIEIPGQLVESILSGRAF